MRKLATILVLLFALVQAAPVICSICSLQTRLFLVDEEKGPEKTEKNETKEIKIIQTLNNCHKEYNPKTPTPFLLADKISLSPCLEQHTPPPDFI